MTDEFERLSTAISEAVKKRFTVERQSQAQRIINEAVVSDARKHFRKFGNLREFATDHSLEEAISRFRAEYAAEGDYDEAQASISASQSASLTAQASEAETTKYNGDRKSV